MPATKTLGDIVRRPPVTVTPETTVLAAARLMAQQKVGSVLVMEKDRLTGILTERDLAFRVVAEPLDPGRCPVSQVMSRNPVTAPKNTSIEDAIEVLRKHKFRHLPVVDQGKVVGMISLRDVLDVEVQEVLAEMYHLKLAMMRGD